MSAMKLWFDKHLLLVFEILIGGGMLYGGYGFVAFLDGDPTPLNPLVTIFIAIVAHFLLDMLKLEPHRVLLAFAGATFVFELHAILLQTQLTMTFYIVVFALSFSSLCFVLRRMQKSR